MDSYNCDRKIGIGEFLSKAGGIGWLKENFYRAVSILNPEIPEMTVPIREISTYFGLTPLLHYYYLKNGHTSNRKDAYAFFDNDKTIPEHIRESAKILAEAKKGTGEKTLYSRSLLEASHSVLSYVGNVLNPENTQELKNEDISYDENSKIISAVLGRDISMEQKLCYFPKGNFSEVSDFIKRKASDYPNISVEEYVETLMSIINDPTNNVSNRMYFFEENDLRSTDETDFSSISKQNIVNSWEKGIATYVQRLNEIYLNSDTISSNDVKLAQTLASIGHYNYCQINGIEFDLEKLRVASMRKDKVPNEESFFKSTKFLSYLGDRIIETDRNESISMIVEKEDEER